MLPQRMLRYAIDPALALMGETLGRSFNSTSARVQLLATSGQESNWSARIQGGGGPAHGFWQFELGSITHGGGVTGVMRHDIVGPWARAMCDALHVGHDPSTVYQAIIYGDLLAAIIARLNYWANAKPLPAVPDSAAAYRYYTDTWNPGKPDASRWPSYYAPAVAAVSATP